MADLVEEHNRLRARVSNEDYQCITERAIKEQVDKLLTEIPAIQASKQLTAHIKDFILQNAFHSRSTQTIEAANAVFLTLAATYLSQEETELLEEWIDHKSFNNDTRRSTTYFRHFTFIVRILRTLYPVDSEDENQPEEGAATSTPIDDRLPPNVESG